MNAYMSQYKNNQISTATPEQILIMLYDGALRFVTHTSQAIHENDPEKKSNNINKTVAILSELSATLDHEIGGEIAENLAALYSYMIRELTAVNLNNDHNRLENVKSILSQLRDAWVQAIQINNKTTEEGKISEQVPPITTANAQINSTL